jgi:hypothetical protein
MDQTALESIKPPILITGCARSGTSMVAGIVHMSGAWGGVMRGKTRYNAKGMFENKEIVNSIIKPMLRSWGCDPMGQKPLPRIETVKHLPDAVQEKLKRVVLKSLIREGLRDQQWMYKGAKMCLMWPLWAKAFPDAKWIIVRRETEDIVSSCLRTAFMRAYQKRSGWLMWVAEHEKRFEEMTDAGLEIHEVWPQRMIAGDFTEIQQVINNIGLNWDFEKVRDFIDPGLWRKWKSRRPRHGK